MTGIGSHDYGDQETLQCADCKLKIQENWRENSVPCGINSVQVEGVS